MPDPEAKRKDADAAEATEAGAAEAEKDKIILPAAKSIFSLGSTAPVGEGKPAARTGELLGIETPAFTALTSRAFPLSLRPEMLDRVLTSPRLNELPVGDVLIRQERVQTCPNAAEGYRGFWPHLRGNLAYCSFRNPRQSMSVIGGDAICSVETAGGRRKVGPKELLELQRVLQMDIVAAPAEEVPLGVSGNRRTTRAASRAADWLKEILETKATDPALSSFDWHVLAGIQGAGDLKVRKKACEAAAALPVSGFWIGGLGYDEELLVRGQVLQTVAAALPPPLPRFLPLNSGAPAEVLQAVLLGVDVFELPFPTHLANSGIALTFAWEPSKEELEALGGEDSDAVAKLLAELLPPPLVEAPAVPAVAGEQAAAAGQEAAQLAAAPAGQPPAAPAVAAPAAAAPKVAAPVGEEAAGQPAGKAKQGGAKRGAPGADAAHVVRMPMARQLRLKSPECREDFGPISPDSPVKQYSRAYLCHLLEVRELLATMLLVHHNLHVYGQFFAAIRAHIKQGSIRRFAAWFLRTQTSEQPAEPAPGPNPKRRKP